MFAPRSALAFVLVCLCFASVCRPCVSLPSPDPLLVTLPSGQWRGEYSAAEPSVAQWRSIRYAAPPVGSHRWSPPQPLGSDYNDTVVREAADLPPACFQFGTFVNPVAEVNQTDDCLFVAVHVPTNVSSAAPLPVRVWIHGGGLLSGSILEYPAAPLAAASSSIVVTVQYRVGFFGFAFTPQALQTGRANLGLQDQQAALRWVRDNIAAFGGDPTNVMLQGESAGGLSVLLHLHMSGSTSLFHRAIAESPGPWDASAYQTATSNHLFWVLHLTACRNYTSPGTSALLEQCLTDQPASTLHAQLKFAAPMGLALGGPATMPAYIAAPMLQIMRTGTFNKTIPVAVGVNKEEGEMFVYSYNSLSLSMNRSSYYSVLSYYYLPAAQLALYESVLNSSLNYFDVAAAIVGDSIINAPMTSGVAVAAAQSFAPWYIFSMQHRTAQWTFPLNATHESEIAYMFNTPLPIGASTGATAQLSAAEYALSAVVVNHTSAFHMRGELESSGWTRVPPSVAGVDIVYPTCVRAYLYDLSDSGMGCFQRRGAMAAPWILAADPGFPLTPAPINSGFAREASVIGAVAAAAAAWMVSAGF